MKVLFATLPQPKNRFVQDLKDSISKKAEVVYDFQEFWNCSNHYDIVHIHEPEYLSFDIEKCMYNTDPIPSKLWEKLILCLEHWNKKSILLHTRHVQEPHVRIDDEFKKLYRTVFSYCHGVAHFASYSIEQFKKFYPEMKYVQHQVIPHQNYESLPNEINRKEARKKLNINYEATVLLVFGMIKEHEKTLIKDAFDAIPDKNKVLLAPGWKTRRRPISWIRLREWVYKLELFLALKDKKIRTDLGFIEEKDAQLYCKSADLMLIPRTNELNSGNIALGFTFGLVVLGRNGGDIGQILTEFGNPVFNPKSKTSMTEAVEEGLKLAEANHGNKNSEIAIENWKIGAIANNYIDFYKALKRENGD